MSKTTIFLSITILVVFISVYSCSNSGIENGEKLIKTLAENKLIEQGRYLVTIMGCNDCHSPKIMGPAGPQIDSANMLSGYPSTRPLPTFPLDKVKEGFVIVNGDMTAVAGPWGTTYAANITSDTTGIGMWKEAQFKNALIHGKYKGLEGSRMIMPPMPWQNFITLKDEDAKAIFHYLQSTRPVKNVVPAFQPMTN
jgi:hypothetical protein